MARYVIDPDVALHLARNAIAITDEHQILAPTLFRSQVLSTLFQYVRSGRLTQEEAKRQLTYVRALRLRLLGDRVLQDVAWKIADQLGWSDTFQAEYIALTQLPADAFITLDRKLADSAKELIALAPIEVLRRRTGER